MAQNEQRKARLSGPLLSFVAIASISLLLFLVTWLIDFADSPLTLLDAVKGAIGTGALTGLPEVIVGVLGVSITVVAIIVELASNRYTARITELFMTSAVNIAILGFFVITGMMCLWVSVVAGYQGTVPAAATIVTLSFVGLCLLLLLPYFAFVFNFVNPHNIIDRMGVSVLGAVRRGGSGGAQERMKHSATRGIEQLADVASGAIESKDKVVCMHAVSALGRLAADYLEEKPRLRPDWFSLDAMVRENPDFVSMQNDILKDIEDNRYWVEMKILRQFQMLYGESLNRMRDINYLLAIHTRKTAEKALDTGDEAVVALCVKFFNTFLRATINARDVRTAYNVLNQYRLLAEGALIRHKGLVAVDIARRFKYYGQLGFASGIAFVLETAAYDLCELNEMAFVQNAPCLPQLLDILLEVDKEAEEGHSMEASLRGVRKAQIKLATFFLTRGAQEPARTIFNDMKDELPSRLQSIHEELSGIRSRDFWEINDRGINFDYLDVDRRAALETFFSWFDADAKKQESACSR